ncbi:hypothetical protein [Streptomyces sp. NPDC001422]|uniref:hypothetical protein n=1 Tax=Streptomyces sp. NPDC001422 TaxID=3364575 RepID=UPI00368EF7B4
MSDLHSDRAADVGEQTVGEAGPEHVVQKRRLLEKAPAQERVGPHARISEREPEIGAAAFVGPGGIERQALGSDSPAMWNMQCPSSLDQGRTVALCIGQLEFGMVVGQLGGICEAEAGVQALDLVG